MPAEQLIVHARDASIASRLGTDVILWGKVTGHYCTRLGSLMIRLESAADHVSILVDEKNLDRLQITDPDALTGRHVIAFGRYRHPDGARWPHVRALYASVAFIPRVARRRS
ncbi:MAG: hypothetical protein KDB08_05360 [Microthrixaceae bacterium]|nr:hypothetical protein [Microthrixaceae bacterium]